MDQSSVVAALRIGYGYRPEDLNPNFRDPAAYHHRLLSPGYRGGNPGTNEALSDFQFYASQVASPLKQAGIDFEVASATEFKVNNSGAFHDFRTGKVRVGYYFVAPGKEPHVEQGVMTDLDLLDVAREQFQLRPMMPTVLGRLPVSVITCLTSLLFPTGSLVCFPRLSSSLDGT